MTPLSDPERQLALSYAPPRPRALLSLLWQLDERMGAIVAAAREPAIGAIRLAWWRDALIRLDDPAVLVPAEPLLAEVAEKLLPFGVSGASLSQLEEGWSALLDDEEPGGDAILGHADLRGAPLFTLSAAILGGERDDLAAGGAGWALAELGHRLRSAEARSLARQEAARRLAAIRPAQWRGALQPLGLLALFAKTDAAMPAGQQRRQGSPGRIARSLAYRLFGR